MMIVVTMAEFAQSYIAQARSSGRCSPRFSSQRLNRPLAGPASWLITSGLGMRLPSMVGIELGR